MSDKKEAMLLFGNVAQCRQDGVLLVPNLIRAAIESVLLPESRLTLKEFLVRRVFSNGGPITNHEICDIARELFGENGNNYIALLEARGSVARLGYSTKEVADIAEALSLLDKARQTHVGAVPEALHPCEDYVCIAVGFRFAAHNRH